MKAWCRWLSRGGVSSWASVVVLGVLVSGCGGGGVLDAVNNPPVPTITSPTNGQILYPGYINTQGSVTDFDDRDPTKLKATWVVTGQAKQLDCKSTPTSDGAVSCVFDLDEGTYTAALTVTDSGGISSVDQVQFTLYNGSPTAEIIEITGTLESSGLVQLVGVVADGEDSAQAIAVTWSSSRDGFLCESAPDNQGVIRCEVEGLSPGEHIITLTATDTFGAIATDDQAITIKACFDEDDDGISTCASGGLDADCDDNDPITYPGASEICDGVDNDCDEKTDEGFDQDGDGYVSCELNGAPADCNDGVAEINPDAPERCNDIDDDCDGLVDEAIDDDGDGVTPCGGDCNDSDPEVYTGAVERCDGVDNDCDDRVDEGFDQDNDGVTSCAGDCNDVNASIHPGATESCNQVDDNCNGLTDEGFDQDGDGFATCNNDCNDGDAGIYPNAAEACNGIDDDCDGAVDETFDLDGDGYSTCGADCDDSLANVNPGELEVCDTVDNNCDGVIDENFDQDGDGWSTCQNDCNDGSSAINPGQVEICNGMDDDCNGQVDEDFDQDVDGYSTCTGDCDDTDATINPGAGEVCNGVDDDCDGAEDEDFDQDGDGYTFCAGDCNDTNSSINPEVAEQCDGVDNNCNDQTDEGVKTTYYVDIDLDGYGSSTNSIEACSRPSGYVSNSEDCDDTDGSINPGAPEGSSDDNGNGVPDGDGVDNDCDGVVDNDTDVFDDDGDGYSENEGDCDDGDPSLSPGMPEGPDTDGDGQLEPDGVDNDCDGLVDNGTIAFDDDGDGLTEQDGDCDDGDASTYPGADEQFDGKDGNCDGLVETEIMLRATESYVGAQSGAYTGFALAGPGDLDDDGLNELVIGAPQYNVRRGAVHVVFGQETFGVNQSILEGSITLEDDNSTAQAGYSLARAGDLNGDGLADFAIGAPYRDSSAYNDVGTTYIVFGRRSGWQNGSTADYSGATISGIAAGVYLGISVAGGGDLNGDGLDDLVIGAPWPTSQQTGAGWLMIVPGKSTGWVQSMAMSTLAKISGRGEEAIGYSVAITGFTNSDGYADILAGGQYSIDQEGDAWFIAGNSGLTANTTHFPDDVGGYHYTGQTADEFVGYYVASAGDVDGNGYDDMLIGRREDGNGSDAKAYLYFGPNLPADDTAEASAELIFVGDSSDVCPCAVAGLGDIDGDGYDDVAISAVNSSAADGGGTIYLFYGGEAGSFSRETSLSSADMIFYGEGSGDQAGLAMTGLGDMNGDGFSDFAIGAPGNDLAGIDAGKVHLLFGFAR